jgi:hypothetical protein
VDATVGDAPSPPVDAVGGPVESSVPDAPQEASPPPCGTSAWATYGHDAQRTFATDACVVGPLTQAWQYTPAAPTGRTFEAVFHAIAQVDGVFLEWMASDAPYTGTTAADRVGIDGKRVWTWDSGTDSNFGNWPTRWNNMLVLDDDGVYYLDATAGTRIATTGVDWWGQTIGDSARLYVVNAMQADGPGLLVGALDATAKSLWQQNLHQACGHGWGDVMGGIALDGSVLFYAPDYESGSMQPLSFSSGLFAFDAAAGTPKWSVTTTTPSSAISVNGGRVYLVEGGKNLVARSETDGSSVWSVAVSGAGAQAPVQADGKVIVATSAGVLAFDAASGKPAWSASAIMAAEPAVRSIITNGCGGTIAVGGATRTSMAAALASNNLVVAASDGIHLLSLSTGMETWHGSLEGGAADLHDPVPIGHTLYVINGNQLVALQGQ